MRWCTKWWLGSDSGSNEEEELAGHFAGQHCYCWCVGGKQFKADQEDLRRVPSV